MDIPKKIHYCWFGENNLSPVALRCIESWKKYMPDYEIIEWNENNFDININKYCIQAYDKKKYAFVSDVARFWILQNEGGIYLDVDVELLNSISGEVSKGNFMAFEDAKLVAPGLVMCSEPNNLFLKECLDMYENLEFINVDGGLNLTTICTYTTDKFTALGLTECTGHVQNVNGFNIYPAEYFCPLNYKTGVTTITENTLAIHYYDASWHTRAEKTANKLRQFNYRVLGEKRGCQANRVVNTIYNLPKTYKSLGALGMMYRIFGKISNKVFMLIKNIVPIQKKIYLYGQTDFDGNAKAIHDFIIKNELNKKYKVIWQVSDKNKFSNNKICNVKFIDKKHHLYQYHMYSSAYIFWEDVPVTVREKVGTTRVYLSHGAYPIKNIKGLINPDEYCDKFICPSSKMIDFIGGMYSTSMEKALVNGLPRTDSLFDKGGLKPKFMEGFNKNIIWMPTFRRLSGTDRNDSEAMYEFDIPLLNSKNIDLLDTKLREENTQLLIKLHPHHDISKINMKSLSNIVIIKNPDDYGVDNNELLKYSDALVTDYSSVYFDYLLLNKPISFILDDIKDYKLGFSLPNITEFMAGEHVYTFEELLEFISEIESGMDLTENKRKNIVNEMLEYPDGLNTERLLKQLQIIN